MKLITLLITLVLPLSSFAQSRPVSKGNAKTNGTCSPANTGDHNRFVIACGIGQQQGQQMIAILNKILANSQKLPADIVLQKLDEILKHINPNRAVKVYDCSGRWRSSGPGADSVLETDNGGDARDFDSMAVLANGRLYAQMIIQCEQLKKSKPEWLTPLIFRSWAYAHLNQIEKAKELLKEYEATSGPAYEDPHCERIVNELHKTLD